MKQQKINLNFSRKRFKLSNPLIIHPRRQQQEAKNHH